jgi:hypothetical protein
MSLLKAFLPAVALSTVLLLALNPSLADQNASNTTSIPESTQWSIRYLARAGNLILAATDAALDKKPGFCGIKYEDSSRLSQNLKALVDEKIRNLTAAQKKQLYVLSETCERDCTCDIYAIALEADSNPKAKALLKELNLRTQQVTPQKRSLCARKFVAFCQSTLLQHLRKE